MLDNIFTIVSLFVLIPVLFQSYFFSYISHLCPTFSIFLFLLLSYLFYIFGPTCILLFHKGLLDNLNIPSTVVLMKCTAAEFFTTGCPSWCQPPTTKNPIYTERGSKDRHWLSQDLQYRSPTHRSRDAES